MGCKSGLRKGVRKEESLAPVHLILIFRRSGVSQSSSSLHFVTPKPTLPVIVGSLRDTHRAVGSSHSMRTITAKVQQDDALPSCLSSPVSKWPFCDPFSMCVRARISVLFLLVILLFKTALTHGTKVLSCVPKHTAVMCLTENTCE